ncbi:MAG: hypothetical protein IJ870_02515, partial [Alphaproteobacteria bacterium]|nr:hypothetical protein [Alphaproteobacteria bacterium]
LYGSGVCVPDGTTPTLRSLDALMRRTAQGMTGKKALLLSPPPYLPPSEAFILNARGRIQ